MCPNFPVINKVVDIVIVDAVGLIIDNIGILPEGS